MNDVRVGEVHIDVAVRVSGRVVFERDLLAVKVEGALCGENIARDRTGGRSQKGKIPTLNSCVHKKMLASVLMGENRCTCRMQPFIAIGVVEVPVRVDKVRDRIGANARKSVGNLWACPGKTGVDEELAVATGEYSDVAPSTQQDAYIAPKSLYGDRGIGSFLSCFLYETRGRDCVRKSEEVAWSEPSGGSGQARRSKKATARNIGTQVAGRGISPFAA